MTRTRSAPFPKTAITSSGIAKEKTPESRKIRPSGALKSSRLVFTKYIPRNILLLYFSVYFLLFRKLFLLPRIEGRKNNRGDKNSGTRYNPVIESFRNKAHQADNGQHGSIDGKESDEHLFVYFKFLLFAASKFNKRISGRRNVIIISQIPDISSGIHPL